MGAAENLPGITGGGRTRLICTWFLVRGRAQLYLPISSQEGRLCTFVPAISKGGGGPCCSCLSPQRVSLPAVERTYLLVGGRTLLEEDADDDEEGDVELDALDPARLVRVDPNAPLVELHLLRLHVQDPTCVGERKFDLVSLVVVVRCVVQ